MDFSFVFVFFAIVETLVLLVNFTILRNLQIEKQHSVKSRLYICTIAFAVQCTGSVRNLGLKGFKSGKLLQNKEKRKYLFWNLQHKMFLIVGQQHLHVKAVL